MNKIFIITLLVFLTLGQSFEPAQQCIKSFFKSAQAKDVTVSDKCFGVEFDAGVKTLKEALDKEEVELFVATIKKMGTDIYFNCPKDDFTALYQIIQKKIDDKSILDNIVKKITETIKIALKEYKSPTHTGESVGAAAGSIVNIFIRENSLLRRHRRFKTKALAVLEGILVGLGKDESSTLCHDDIKVHAPEIVQIVRDLIKAIREGKDILNALEDALMEILGMVEIIDDCNLYELYESVKSILTKRGLLQLVERLKANIHNFIVIGQGLIQAIVEKNDSEIGMNVGKAIKIILDFYVN